MTRRTDRVGEAFREVLGELIQRQVKDPRVGFVTITTVRVTPDLSKAHVFYTVLGGDEEREQTRHGLERASGYLRSEAARQIRLRTTPELVFHYDDSFERGRTVDTLIEQLRHEHDDAGERDAGERDAPEGDIE
jgi:ribosome-binding factor A